MEDNIQTLDDFLKENFSGNQNHYACASEFFLSVYLKQLCDVSVSDYRMYYFLFLITSSTRNNPEIERYVDILRFFPVYCDPEFGPLYDDFLYKFSEELGLYQETVLNKLFSLGGVKKWNDDIMEMFIDRVIAYEPLLCVEIVEIMNKINTHELKKQLNF